MSPLPLVFLLSCYLLSTTLVISGVEGIDARSIVDEHNLVRTLIQEGRVPNQPKGKGLKPFKWDNYLASEAQKIANRCVFQHAKVTDKRFYVGQNLFALYWADKRRDENWKSAISSWYNEYKKYRYEKVTSSNYRETGHYTQLVWASTEYVGCAYAYCPNASMQNLYVCNYGPGGNIIGQYPYPKA